MAPLPSLRHLFDAIAAPVAVLDRDGTIVEVNRAWRRSGGRNGLLIPRDAVGSNYLEVCDAAQGLYSEGAAEVARGLRQVLAGERLSFEFEHASPSPSQPRWFRLHAAPLQPGLASGAVITHWEITEHVLRAGQLHAERMEALLRFAGGLAHHYNNILAVVLGFGSLLREELASNAHQRGYLDEILQAAQRGADLGSMLLAFCGQSVSYPRSLDVNAVISAALEDQWASLPRGIKLQTFLAPSLGAVRADPQQITRVLEELITNAVEATPSGGTITITTQNEAVQAERLADPIPGKYVAVSVRDTGQGMPPDVLEHIFEPFFTTKEIGRGMGLGLSVAYGLVKQNRGYLVAESEVGRGSTLRVFLPRVEPDDRLQGDVPPR